MRVKYLWLAMALAAASTAEAGVVVQTVVKDSTGKESVGPTMYAQAGAFREDHLDDRGHVNNITLFRNGVIWQIDVQKRVYTKVDKAAFSQRMAAGNERMQAALAQLPPERRAAIEKTMKDMQARHHDYTWTDTGKGEQVAQWSCRDWDGARDGKVQQQLCVVPFGGLPGGDELATAMRQALATAKDVISAVPMMEKNLGDMFTGLDKINGWPVLTRHMSAGKAYRTESVKSIERQSLAADKFEIPKGFTERTLTQSED